jgi:hypothetical protein
MVEPIESEAHVFLQQVAPGRQSGDLEFKGLRYRRSSALGDPFFKLN